MHLSGHVCLQCMSNPATYTTDSCLESVDLVMHSACICLTLPTRVTWPTWHTSAYQTLSVYFKVLMVGVMQVRSHFRPEFINRIDEFTVFNPLNRADIKRIVRLQAKRVEERLTAKKMKMKLLEPAIEFLAVQCSWAIAACLCIYPWPFMVTCTNEHHMCSQ